jgi:hypothetical protein
LFGLLKDVEIKKLEFNTIVFIHSNSLFGSGIPVLHFFLSQVIPSLLDSYFLLMLSMVAGSLVSNSTKSRVIHMLALEP